MGIITELYMAPASDADLPVETFEALVVELLKKKILRSPAGLVTGKVDAFDIWMLSEEPDRPKLERGLRLMYLGADIEALREAIRKHYATSDLCVWFPSPDWENEAVTSFYDDEGYECRVGLFHFREPTSLTMDNAYIDDGELDELGVPEEDRLMGAHTCRSYLKMVGKRAPIPDVVEKTVLERVLKKHFGKKLWVDASYF
jgi:hypothetical protein